MAKQDTTSEVIKLSNMRLSFPQLYTPKAFQVGQDPRFEATFLLDPSAAQHAATIKILKVTARDLIALKYGEDAVAEKAKAFVFCWYDGNRKEYDGYANMWVLPSHNKTRPAVVNRARDPVVEGENQAPYAGCYVNATVTLWLQDNQYGKRINCNLRGVQFAKDGEAFSGVAPVDVEEEFEALEDNTASNDNSGSSFDEELFG